MSQLKAKIGHLQMPESAGVFEWVYITKDPIEIIEAAGYFDVAHSHVSKYQRLRVIAEKDDGSWSEALFAVLHSEAACVLIKLVEDWREMIIEVTGELTIANQRQDRQGQEIVDVMDKTTGRTVRRGIAVFDARAIIEHMSVPLPPKVENIDTMTIAELQKRHKRLTGKGFAPDTPIEEMREANKQVAA